ncbi:MAG: hypothetical protein ABEH35_03555 [Haloarculaceae archaeon]
MELDRGHDSGWSFVATQDAAPALIDAILRLDVDDEYTKTELSEAADVSLKELYLSGMLDDVVEMGLLEKRDRDGGEDRYVVNDDSDIYDAAVAFDDAILRRLQVDSA